MVAKNFHIVYEPSEWYTFDDPRGVSDIEVTINNQAADRAFVARRKIKGGWGMGYS